jgi:hypothetical protein
MKAGLVGRLVAAVILSVPLGIVIEKGMVADIELYRGLTKDQIIRHLADTSLTTVEWILGCLVMLVAALIGIEFVGYFFGLWFRRMEARAVQPHAPIHVNVAGPPAQAPPAPSGGKDDEPRPAT